MTQNCGAQLLRYHGKQLRKWDWGELLEDAADGVIWQRQQPLQTRQLLQTKMATLTQSSVQHTCQQDTTLQRSQSNTHASDW